MKYRKDILVYEKLEPHSGPLKYRKKQVVIDAFKLHEDLQYPYEPKWFMDAIENGLVDPIWEPTGRFGTLDPMRLEHCVSCKILTPNGIIQANEGDYIVRGRGEIYVMESDIFELDYESMDAYAKRRKMLDEVWELQP